MLYYSLDYPDSVQNLTFTMIPINEAGIGQTTTFYESIKECKRVPAV